MTGLGFLGTGTYSEADAINAAGNVVVGYSDNGGGGMEAFRWQLGTGMQSVATWLTQAGVSTSGFSILSAANGVSANGNTVVGIGTGIGSNSPQAYIARVSPEGSGIVGLTDLSNSMAQTLAVSSQMEGLTSLTMNGAHHRTLMDMAMTDGKNCGWVSGDLGHVYRQANGYTGMTEVGACHDLAERAVRVGLGIGSSYSDLDLANNGHSRLNGQYGVAEIDWQLPNRPVIASLLGTYGQWNADLTRGYAIAGTVPSAGSTDVTAYSLRARLDWTDAFQLGKVSFSPRAAYTVTRSEVGAYQETGGSAPASFDDQNHTAEEARLGVTGKYTLNDKTTLLGHGEVAHRFDASGAAIQGNIDALGVNIGFNQPGNAVQRDWVRVGAEVDYKINPRNVINASTFIATAGQDADITAAVSWKFLF
jgi:probable HAF family extracellular repeat protein